MARGNIGDKDFNIQFNDSLLSSKAYINPRYEGCKNTAAVVDNNSFQLTSGNAAERDGLLSSFPKLGAPVEHYTNVIFRFDYIGGADNELKNWSNVSTVKAYEIYDSKERDAFATPLSTLPFYIREVTPTEYESYDRRLKTAFKVGNKCKILLSDKGITNSLRDEYTVHFNRGNAPGNSYLIWGNEIEGNNLKFNFTPGVVQNVGPANARFYDYLNPSSSQISIGVSGSVSGDYLSSIYFTTASGYWSSLGNSFNISGSYYSLTSNNSEIKVDKAKISNFLDTIFDFNNESFEYYVVFNSVKEDFEISSSLNNPIELSSGPGITIKDAYKIKSYSISDESFSHSTRWGYFNIEGNFNSQYENGLLNIGNSGFDGRIYRVTLSNRFLVIDLDKDVELPGETPNGGWIIPQTLEPQLLANISAITQRIQAIEEGATSSTPNFQGGGGSIYVQ